MRLQCSLPTRYVKNGEYPWCALFRKIFKIGVYRLLALYGSTVHPRCIMWLSGHFFLLSVHASLLQSSYTRIKIHGGFGSTWGDNFYMGTQNGSKLEI